MFLSSIKEIDRLTSNGITNIYLNSPYFKFILAFFYCLSLISIKEINIFISKGISNVHLNSSY